MPEVVVYKLTDDVIGIKVRKDAMQFKVDNSMGYMVFKVPAYENWVNDDILEDPTALFAWMEKHENSEQYKTGGMKLPEGNWKFLFSTIDVTEERAKEVVGGDKPIDNFKAMIDLLEIPKVTLAVLKKI